MSEHDAVKKAPLPRTRQSLAADLLRLGVGTGDVLLVHSSLSAIGWVSGGAVAVIQALVDVLTEQGTLVMPAHSADYSDPAEWQHPPVPDHWHQVIRDTMPAFDPYLTPTRQMGRIAEIFRSWPGALRSYHPTSSFVAVGPQAKRITEDHELDYSLGEGSPLARIYELDGRVLLLGVGYDRNTSFHLAEYRAPGTVRVRQGAPIMLDGQRVWQTFEDIDEDSDLFPEIGTAFEAEGQVTVGAVGSAECRLFRQQAAVDFAQAWLTERADSD